MKNILIKWFMAMNSLIIRLSQGRVGSKLGTQTVLILHTLGRKSGRDHRIPIAYFDHEGGYLIVASNWGKDRQADWYLNLKKNPHARVEIRGEVIPVLARESQGEEYDRLWRLVAERHPPYLEYQKMTRRTIPIMVFVRAG